MKKINKDNFNKFLEQLEEKFGVECQDYEDRLPMKELAIKFFWDLTDEDLGKNDDEINSDAEIRSYFQQFSESVMIKIFNDRNFDSPWNFMQMFQHTKTRKIFGGYLLFAYREEYEKTKEKALWNMSEVLGELRLEHEIIL